MTQGKEYDLSKAPPGHKIISCPGYAGGGGGRPTEYEWRHEETKVTGSSFENLYDDYLSATSAEEKQKAWDIYVMHAPSTGRGETWEHARLMAWRNYEAQQKGTEQ